MRGLTFRQQDGICLENTYVCSEVLPFVDDRPLCFYRGLHGTCAKENDVICLDGTCRLNARCNQTFECPHGEDEYRCSYRSIIDETFEYRVPKAFYRHIGQIQWNIFPLLPVKESVEKTITTVTYENAYLCNRGVAVGLIGEKKISFCSPVYYGDHREFYSDRVTVITHLDLPKEMSNAMFKVLATLQFGTFVIDYHQFIINATLEHDNYIKHRFTFLYSRSSKILHHEVRRYLNRSDLIENHPYSVHFDLFLLNTNETIELGRWSYPVYFDYLPAFRLATVLKFPYWYRNQTTDPCVHYTCHSNSICLPLFNHEKKFYCSCQNGFYGEECRSSIVYLSIGSFWTTFLFTS